MVNVVNLKVGELVAILVDNRGMDLKAGDILRVIKVGWSRFDDMPFADCKTDKGYTLEIMKNFRDFETIK